MVIEVEYFVNYVNNPSTLRDISKGYMMNQADKQAMIKDMDMEAEFIWEVFFPYCKSFYAEGGVYGDQVNASEAEIEMAILDVLDEIGYDFQGDTVDREKVRSNIERNRLDNNSRMIYRAVHQSMQHQVAITKELI